MHKKGQELTNSIEIIRLFCLSFTSVAVNTFVIISGYFGINYKIERFIKLILQTFFYSACLLLVSSAIGWHTFDIKKDIFSFFPILTKQYWFVTSYVVLYVISPWLNLSIKNVDKKTYKQILIVGFIIIYVWPTFSYLFNTAQFIGDSGFGIVNFSYLYLLGRYLNMHYVQNHTSAFYFRGYILTGITLFICQYSLSWILGFEFTSWISYNTVFIFTGAIFLFLTFSNLNIQSNIINYWAQPCLAVYLIHLNPYVWKGVCETIGVRSFYGFQYLFLLMILPNIVYIVCAIIEIARLKIMIGIENKIVSIFTSSQ